MAEVTNLAEQLQVIQAQMNLFKMTRPWWRSGSAWLAGLSWLNFYAMFWAGLVGIFPEWISSFTIASTIFFFFMMAISTSMVAYGKGEKQG